MRELLAHGHPGQLSHLQRLRTPITRTIPEIETLNNLALLRELLAHVHFDQLAHNQIVFDSVCRIHHMHLMITLMAGPTNQIPLAFIFLDVSIRIDDIGAKCNLQRHFHRKTDSSIRDHWGTTNITRKHTLCLDNSFIKPTHCRYQTESSKQ